MAARFPRKLTRLAHRRRMLTMVRWSRALASLLVVVAVLTSTWATCVEGATAAVTQQMACCKAGHDDCPMKDSASDCCKQSGPQVEFQGTIVKASSVSAPISVPVQWLTVQALSLVAPNRARVSYHASPPDLLDAPPPYIAFSGLLI
jgi:hypothetical protein